MASATATRPRPTVTRHLHIRVDVPADSTEEERNTLVVQALVQELEKRGGSHAWQEREAPPQRPTAAPTPRHCRSAWEFLTQLRALKELAGLSFAELEERAHDLGYPPLPHSTIGRILAPDNETRLPTRGQLTSLVLVCGASVDELREWALAWGSLQPNPALVMVQPWVLPGGKDDSNRVVSLVKQNSDYDRSRRGRFPVDCPACQGLGKVPRHGSAELYGCQLCWERGVVSAIVADRWRNHHNPEEGNV